MIVSSYVMPDEEDPNYRNVWIKCGNGDEYDVTVQEIDEEGWKARGLENVIADIPLPRRDTDEIEQMKEMAVETVEAIESINESD